MNARGYRWRLVLLVATAIPTFAIAQGRGNALVDARSHYFGFENVNQRTGEVDKNKVLVSWFSVSSLAVAARGRVFLLDAYIYRPSDIFRPSDIPEYVPTNVQELVDLQPEAIFIGHGHFDHADNVAYIAGKTGARIFGAAEHCTAMQADAVKIFGQGAQVRCTSLASAGSAPGAEIREINALRPDICITSFKHVHSATVALDPTFPPNPINPIRDPRVSTLYPPQPASSLDTATTGSAGPGGFVSMFYQFTVAGSDFSFAWHDTSGPLKEQAPQVLQMLRFLPKVDVEFGAAVSIGETVNGVRDIAMYIEALQPKIYYMLHTDLFNVGASKSYEMALSRQFDIFNIPAKARAEIRGFHDPYDYSRAGLASFDFKDKLWRETPAGRASPTCRL